MPPALAHRQKQIQNRHRRRNNRDLRNIAFNAKRLLIRNTGNHILQMDRPHDIVQVLFINRNTANLLLGQHRKNILITGFNINRNNIGPRHHHLINCNIPQRQNIRKQSPLMQCLTIHRDIIRLFNILLNRLPQSRIRLRRKE